MDETQRRAIVEALIFAADEPVSLEALAEILEIPQDEVEATIEELITFYDAAGRGLRLTRVAGGFRFSTRPDYHPWVKLLFKNQRTVRLSRAALQSLAIIAYRQPVTAPEIEEIRGVDPSGLLRNLLEKRLVKILGRKDVVGRPILYGTTREFLTLFGLDSLDDLPSLEEFEELLRADLGAEMTEVAEAEDQPAVATEEPTAETEEPTAEMTVDRKQLAPDRVEVPTTDDPASSAES